MKTEQIDAPQDLPVMISDAAWQSIHPFLKTLPTVYVGNPEACRRFLSALIWITKEGATWRSLPKVYGYWNAIYRRFGRWCDAGVFESCMNISMRPVISLRSSWIQQSCGPILPQRGLPKNGGQSSEALGRSRGGFTTKLNAAVNDAFLPLRFYLNSGGPS